MLAVPWGAAWADGSDQERPLTPERPYFGAVLDWAHDSAVGYAQRLGTPPALYGQTVRMPMSGQEQTYLKAYFSQLSAEGAHALLTVEPRGPLSEVKPAAAEAFAAQVADAASAFNGAVFLRYGPDMNAPWVSWGQQPEAYRASFAVVAGAARSAVRNAVMLWSPASGRDYPFRAAASLLPDGQPLGSLDTNGDGTWNQDDDAYAPYYPGDEFVDWAGLSLYHDSTADGPANNTLPGDGEFSAELDPAGSTPGVENFYKGYGQERHKPLLVQTGAGYSASAGGATEADIKRAWWNQVLAAAQNGKYPALKAVVWNETVEERDGGTVVIDWRITSQPLLAEGFQTALKASDLETGPVTEKSQKAVPAVEAPKEVTGTVLTGWAAWTTVGTFLMAIVLLWAFSGRAAGSNWAYPGNSEPRDLRIDLLRGMAIVFVVVNHVGISSVFQLLTQESIGVASGAELFVLFSGAVVGMVYGPRALQDLGQVVERTTKRSAKLYVTALSVALMVYALSLLPFIDAAAVTTFTDQGGPGDTAGTTYNLYAGMEGLLQFPVPEGLVPALLMLQIGPWQFNVIGLYVLLLLIAPLILAALTRGLTWVVLAISLALYTAGALFRFRLLPSQFEDSFPLLVWQVLFTLGMVAGFNRRRLVKWFAAPRRRVLLAACLFTAAAGAIFSWSGPYLTNNLDVRLALLPDAMFRQVYDSWFDRTYLGAGRLVNVLAIVVAFYTLLSTYWKPIERVLGWFLIPLGQATLYVFIMHVFFILALANVPVLKEGNLWLNTAAYVLLLGVLWTMVKTRFLFRLVPR